MIEENECSYDPLTKCVTTEKIIEHLVGLDKEGEEVFEKDRAPSGLFRSNPEPSEEAKKKLIESEVLRFRKHLEMLEYNGDEKCYAIDCEASQSESTKENLFQRIARIAERQFYTFDRPDSESLFHFDGEKGDAGRMASKTAKKFAIDMLYDLSAVVFALKMTSMKSDTPTYVFDEILEILDRKRTAIELMEETFPTQYQHIPYKVKTLSVPPGIGQTKGAIATTYISGIKLPGSTYIDTKKKKKETKKKRAFVRFSLKFKEQMEKEDK